VTPEKLLLFLCCYVDSRIFTVYMVMLQSVGFMYKVTRMLCKDNIEILYIS